MRTIQRNMSYAEIENSVFFGAALISALLFLAFFLPLSIKTGLYGLGLLSLPLFLYLISFLLSSFLVPALTARLVSVRMARRHPADAVRLVRTLLLYASASGLILTVFFYLFGPVLASLCRVPEAAAALKLIGPALWLSGCLGVLRGYYIGRGSSVLSALSVFVEQLFGGVLRLLLAGFFLKQGAKADLLYGRDVYTASYGAQAAVLSFAAGALFALLFLFVFSRLSGGVMQEANEGRRMEGIDSIHRSLERSLLPGALALIVLLFGIALDLIVFTPRAVSLYGEGRESIAIVGAFSAMLLFFFAPVIAAGGAFSGMFPALLQAVQLKDKKRIAAQLRLSAKFMSVFAMLCCALLAALSEPLCTLFFAGEDTALLGRLLRYGAVFVFFALMSVQKCAALCGLGYYADILKNAVWAFLLHFVCLMIALYGAKLEMMGVLLTNLLSVCLFWALNTAALMLRIRVRPHPVRTYVIPFFCSVLSFLLIFFLYRLCAAVLPEAVLRFRATAFAVIVLFSAATFLADFLALMLTKTVKMQELSAMPLGPFLCRLCRRIFG